MNILILDDSLARLVTFRRKLIGAVVTCVEHSKDCIKELEENGPFDYLFLDHDLDQKTYVPSGPGTGYEVALWLKNNPEKKPKNIILHTCNEVGILKMKEELPEAVCLPGVFGIDFNLSNLDMIDILYSKQIKIFS